MSNKNIAQINRQDNDEGKIETRFEKIDCGIDRNSDDESDETLSEVDNHTRKRRKEGRQRKKEKKKKKHKSHK